MSFDSTWPKLQLFIEILHDPAQFPATAALIGNIHGKKAKDNVVLAFVIACCICFMLWLFILR